MMLRACRLLLVVLTASTLCFSKTETFDEKDHAELAAKAISVCSRNFANLALGVAFVAVAVAIPQSIPESPMESRSPEENKHHMDLLLATEAAKGAKTFSHDLSQIKRPKGCPPTITLFGEKHNCPDCQEGTRKQKSECRSSSYVFGHETLSSINSENYHGLEEARSRLAARLFLSKLYLSEIESPLGIGSAFTRAAELMESPETIALWNRIDRSDLPSDYVKVLDRIGKLRRDETALGKLRKEKEWTIISNSHSFPKVVDRMIVLFLKDLETTPSVSGQPPLEVFRRGYSAASDAVRAKSDMYFNDDTSRFFREVCISWRNEQMADNLMRLYGSAAQQPLNLQVRVGELHLPGMYRILRQSLDASGARDVRILVDESTVGHGHGNAEILAKIRDEEKHRDYCGGGAN